MKEEKTIKNESVNIDQTQRTFLSLINRTLLDYTDISIEPKEIELPVDWDAILSLANTHNLFPFIFKEISKIDPDFQNTEKYKQYYQISMWRVAHQTIQTEAFSRLYKSFLEADLHPIVMKGIICRSMYGKLAEYRASGDEDILIKPEEFEAVKQVMINNGFTPEREEITEWDLQELQEITFESKALKVEVHVNPIGHENGMRRRMNQYFDQKVFERAQDIVINNVKYHIMSHTDHYLFLVIHAFKHFLGSGFGIRQVLDILLYREKYGCAIDWKYIKNCLEEIHAYSFYVDLISIGEQYIGFPGLESCEGFDDKTNCPDELLKDIMDSGVFGKSEMAHSMSSRILTAALNEEDKQTNKKPSKMRLVFDTVFPSKEQMRYWYPELNIKTWHVPFLWIRRYYRFIKRSIDNGKGLASESTNIGMQRLELLKKYKIID